MTKNKFIIFTIFFLFSCGGTDSNSIILRATPDFALVSEDSEVEINVLLNDSYIEDSPINIVTNDGENGTTVVQNNFIIYKPLPNYNGSDNFTYTISQGNQISSSSVIVTVEEINDAPTIDTPSIIYIDENQRFVITFQISDIDGDNLDIILSGTDASSFTLTEENELVFKDLPDFESKDLYFITLTVSDGLEVTSKNIEIYINDIPELNTSPTYPLSIDEYDYTYFERSSLNFSVEQFLKFSFEKFL